MLFKINNLYLERKIGDDKSIKMKLEVGEYTTQTFLTFLQDKYTKKTNGEPFTSNDIAQYLLRGYTPYRYGNHAITAKIENGIRIISVTEEVEGEKQKQKKLKFKNKK